MDLLARLAADGLLNEDAASCLEDCESLERRSVVLVGVTGDGKSSTGNTLCGSNIFEVSGGFKSETQEVKHADFKHTSGDVITIWRVMDTVGLHDTDLSQTEVLDRFSLFADKTRDGIDVFLFVVRWGRFKPEHDAALNAFVRNCGEVALQHVVLVFTHCTASQEDLQKQLSTSAPATLQRWLPFLQDPTGSYRAIGIQNGEPEVEARAQLLMEVVEQTVSQNKGERYSNEALAEARRKQAAVEEAERAAFQSAVEEWRRSVGPVIIEREEGVVTRPPVGVRDGSSTS
mmetsp:Transcript_73874/g.153921  ORF Transcript_73874/g.153921 Transcript_73874/m.153921 type:complete len:288 (-) Transcript_73874:153-1016(-)|eukprot:CAMPEP_0206420066 /NCGR_PEP_ID=MMETSP0324_2-20121206/582_1 /ASSEMBLY_ACC=CAM_ASM_000836 /TAXON_ID=2866 /ORGANISM="Crypthecodinium cohnii, Strain Seligo" /LENGTH=287 /DNA_ID=CAMNT_0053883801 /DNA_START=14 /DNA_END=877 /DNA_ORIENTATION=-